MTETVATATELASALGAYTTICAQCQREASLYTLTDDGDDAAYECLSCGDYTMLDRESIARPT